jgi:hypothetical protein
MESPNPFRHWERSAWRRIFVLRWLYKMLVRRGIWYVRFSGEEEQLGPDSTVSLIARIAFVPPTLIALGKMKA